MYFLAHQYFAYQCRDLLKITDEKAFSTGAILPDIRYFAGLNREKTHPSLSDIQNYIAPISVDIATGVQVHILLDTLATDTTLLQQLRGAFPRFIHKHLSPSLLWLLVELVLLDEMQSIPSRVLAPVPSQLCDYLDVSQEKATQFVTSMNKIYSTLSVSTLETIIDQNSLLATNKKIQILRRWGMLLVKLPFFREYLGKKLKQPIADVVQVGRRKVA